MIAKVAGNLRGTLEIKNDKGVLFIHRLEQKGKNGYPYFVDVVSQKNGRKPGDNEFVVSVRSDRAKDGRFTGELKCWEV